MSLSGKHFPHCSYSMCRFVSALAELDPGLQTVGQAGRDVHMHLNGSSTDPWSRPRLAGARISPCQRWGIPCLCLIIDRSLVLDWGMCHRRLHGLLSHYWVCISVTRWRRTFFEGGGGVYGERGGGLSNRNISHTPVPFTVWALLWTPKGGGARDGGIAFGNAKRNRAWNMGLNEQDTVAQACIIDNSVFTRCTMGFTHAHTHTRKNAQTRRG